LAKEDWVTLWLPGEPLYTKVMTDPLVAVMVGGMNWKIPPDVAASAPTWTTVFCAAAMPAKVKAEIAAVTRILYEYIFGSASEWELEGSW